MNLASAAVLKSASIMSLAISLIWSGPNPASAQESEKAWVVGTWEGSHRGVPQDATRFELVQEGDKITWRMKRTGIFSGLPGFVEGSGTATSLSASSVELEGTITGSSYPAIVGRQLRYSLRRSADGEGLEGHATGGGAMLPVSLRNITRARAASVGSLAVASSVTAYLEDLGRGPVIVWKDQAAMEKGQADRDPLLIACIAPSGTRALVDRVRGSWAWTATVLEGESKGCQGVVGPTDFKTASEREKAERARAQALPGCKARFEALVATQPPGTKERTRLDIDRAIGKGCSDLLIEQFQQAPANASRVWRFSPECRKALDAAEAAQRFDQEASKKYGRRQDWYGDAIRNLPESCKRELDSEDQRLK